MASEAQIAANRRNAEKSTGPKSARGKAAVSRNALRHGLTAERIICFDESEADFAPFEAGLRRTLDPADPVEAQLTEHIVLCAWRLRRAYRVEAELFNAFRRMQPQFPATEIATVFDRAPTQIMALSRYETALDRALHRTFLMLECRQARRRGESVSAPEAVALALTLDGLDRLSAPVHSENYETKPIFAAESASAVEATLIEGIAGSQPGDEPPGR